MFCNVLYVLIFESSMKMSDVIPFCKVLIQTLIFLGKPKL